MNIKSLPTLLIISGTLLTGGIIGQCADAMRFSGAAGLCAALNNNKATLEQAAGETVLLVSKNAGKGLQDLSAGNCDIAMVSGSLEQAANAANAEQAGSVDLTNLKAVEIGADPILFVVHPSNPVNSLSLDQIKGILTGTIKNWKEVGGADAPIDVFALGTRNGPRITVDQQVLSGAAVAKSAIQRENSKDICPIISQKANGIGFVGKSNSGPGVKVLQTDKPVTMPFLLVTKGVPTALQEKAIAAAKSIVNK